MCKVGTGFSEERLAKFTAELKESVIPRKPSYYKVRRWWDRWMLSREEERTADERWSGPGLWGMDGWPGQVGETLDCDEWFDAKVVWEVKAAGEQPATDRPHHSSSTTADTQPVALPSCRVD